MDTNLSRNTLSFIGLATEYCSAMEQASGMERAEFVSAMLRLLPRLYITMSDVKPEETLSLQEPGSLGSYLDEDSYEQVRASVAALLGEDDTYLETFEEDMKYSDTPIAAHISEGLTDIYQDLYNFLTPVRDSQGVLTADALIECRENFANYWAQTLTNLLRPLNHIHFNIHD